MPLTIARNQIQRNSQNVTTGNYPYGDDCKTVTIYDKIVKIDLP